MSNRVDISITTDLSANDLADYFNENTYSHKMAKMIQFLRGALAGNHKAEITTLINEGAGVAASLTMTINTILDTELIEVNNWQLICVDGTPEEDYEFALGATEEETAANLTECINANFSFLTAVADGADITVTCNTKGEIGNFIHIESGATDIEGVGYLSGGVDPASGSSTPFGS